MKKFIEEYGQTVVYVITGTIILALLFGVLKGEWKTYDQTPVMAQAQSNEEFSGIEKPMITVKKKIVAVSVKVKLTDLIDIYQHNKECDGHCSDTCGYPTDFTASELTSSGVMLTKEADTYFLISSTQGISTLQIKATNRKGIVTEKTVTLIFRKE